nr:HNH endonuclease [Halosegnis sp. DT85]
MFTLSQSDPTGEHRDEDEYRIDIRLPEHDNGDRSPVTPTRSEEWTVVICGYDPETELFVLWDDDLYSDGYAWVRHLQVDRQALDDALDDGLGFQERNGGDGGERVIAATKEKLSDALHMRHRLVNIRQLLNAYLPNDWRDIPSHHTSDEVYYLELIAEYILERTDPDSSMADRRSEAESKITAIDGTLLDRCGVSSSDEFDNLFERIDDEWHEIPSAKDIAQAKATIEEQLDEEPELEESTSPPSPTLRGPERETETVQRTARDSAFSGIVRDAYDYQCAICGSERRSPSGNPEVEAAHIYPKRLNGRDDVRNGLALCKLHHWAFDTGWLSLTDDHEVLVRDAPNINGFADFEPLATTKIQLPEDPAEHPHERYLEAHRKIHDFG